MKTLKGFAALEYVLKNKDAILYNRKGFTLQYDKRYKRVAMHPNRYYHDSIVIDDKTMEMEWYTENKKKVLIKIYKEQSLLEVQEHYFFDVDDNLNKLKNGIKEFYQNKRNIEVNVEHELFG